MAVLSSSSSSGWNPSGVRQQGRLLAGRFRVGAQLGRGGMSVVYAGNDERTGRAVALKWIAEPSSSARATERVLREARACSQLRHPNVVELYDVVQDGEQVVLVMERLYGDTLATVLQRGGMPLDRFISVLMAAMYGVAEAHRIGIVHRDVKPENIFLVESGDPERPHVKVIDFGIASAPAARGHTLTNGRDVLGTPNYMSPEQLSSPRNADARADVYAFGVILYRAITGRYPHTASSLPELVQRMSTPVVPAQMFCPNLPSELDRVIGSALARDRHERLTSLPAFIKELVPFTFARGLYAEHEDGALFVRGSAHDDEGFIGASPSIPPNYTRAVRRSLPSRGATALLLLAFAATVLLWQTHRTAPDASSPAASTPSQEDASPALQSPSAPKPRSR